MRTRRNTMRTIILRRNGKQDNLYNVLNDVAIFEEVIIGEEKLYRLKSPKLQEKKLHVNDGLTTTFTVLANHQLLLGYNEREEVIMAYDASSNKTLMTAYHHLEFQEYAGALFVKDINEEGETKRIYSFKNCTWIFAHINRFMLLGKSYTTDNDHLELLKLEGNIFIKDLNKSNKTRFIYDLSSSEIIYSCGLDDLEVISLDKSLFVIYFDENRNIKMFYDLRTKERKESGDDCYFTIVECLSSYFIDKVSSNGKILEIYHIRSNQKYDLINPKYDHLERCVFDGKVFINDVDENGKVKRYYNSIWTEGSLY